MAGTSQASLPRLSKRTTLAWLAVIAYASLAIALPASRKAGLLDDIVYVSDDPAVKKWRQELSGADIYPAHYALKAIDLLPLPNTPPRLLKARRLRRRHERTQDTLQGIEPSGFESQGLLHPRKLESRRKKKGKHGHDEDGYDDESWRGDHGDYGSEKSRGKDSENEDTYDSTEADEPSSQNEDAQWYGGYKDSGFDDGASPQSQKSSDHLEDNYQDSMDEFAPGKEKSKVKWTPAADTEDAYGSPGSGWRAPGKTKASEETANMAGPSDGQAWQEKSSQSEQDQANYDEEESSDQSRTSTRKGHSSDCQTLSHLYDDMGGNEWTVSTGWSSLGSPSSKKCCKAFGVTCNLYGAVTALDLGGNGLSGPLSPALFELRSLSKLNLSANALSGELPDSFDSLPRLTTLYLEQNNLKGSIPPTLQQSYAISSIHISNNNLEGLLSFPNARNLTQLYAARNRFGDLNINENKLLTKVALDDNQFNCALPSLEGLADLQVFSVARNHFTGSPPVASNLQKLVKLDLQANQLSGAFPDVADLPRLQYLGLNGNSDLTGPFPTGKAPLNLITCHVDTLLASSCPAQSVLDDPESLAAKCSVNCRGGGKPSNATSGGNAIVDTTASNPPQVALEAGSTKQKTVDSGMTPASLAESLSSRANQQTSQGLALFMLTVSLLLYLA